MSKINFSFVALNHTCLKQTAASPTQSIKVTTKLTFPTHTHTSKRVQMHTCAHTPTNKAEFQESDLLAE